MLEGDGKLRGVLQTHPPDLCHSNLEAMAFPSYFLAAEAVVALPPVNASKRDTI